MYTVGALCDSFLFTVPTPIITVVALNSQIVGQPLTLECNVSTVRGITSRVDIIWSSNDTELERVNLTTGNSVLYTDTYTISQLNTENNGTVYKCEVVINTSPPVLSENSIILRLNLMGKY